MTYYMLLFTFYRNIAFITAFEHMRPLTELKNSKIKYSIMIFIWSLMTGNMMQPSEAWQHHKAHKKALLKQSIILWSADRIFQVSSLAPYRVFITDLSYEHSFFMLLFWVGQAPSLFYAVNCSVIYSTATPLRVSAMCVCFVVFGNSIYPIKR